MIFENRIQGKRFAHVLAPKQVPSFPFTDVFIVKHVKQKSLFQVF